VLRGGIYMPQAPKYPEVVALVVNSLARYALDVADKTTTDLAVKTALDKRPRSSEFARYSVRSFNRALSGEGAKYFQTLQMTAVKATPLSNTILARARESISARTKSPTANIGRLSPTIIDALRKSPDMLRRPRRVPHYSLNYTGLYCEHETTWDYFTTSDEIYVITTVIPYPLDPTKVMAVKHPANPNQKYYGKVDSGEWRSGPLARIGSDINSAVSIATVVMEQDTQDPDAVHDHIETVAVAAIAVLQKEYSALSAVPEDIGDKIADVFADLIYWLLGLKDDLISDEYVTLYASKPEGYSETFWTLGDYAASAPVEFMKGSTHTGILEHFETTHKGGGATYRVFYTVTKD
jgi:hypothetical protein